MALRTGAGFFVPSSQGAHLFLLDASRGDSKHSGRLFPHRDGALMAVPLFAGHWLGKPMETEEHIVM